MIIRNLTSQPVVILSDDPNGILAGFTTRGSAKNKGRFSLVAEYRTTGLVADASKTDQVVGELKINSVSVPLITTVFGKPYVHKPYVYRSAREPFPAPTDGVYLVVSMVTAQAAKASGRTTRDLLILSDPVYEPSGMLIGIRKFALI